MGENLFEEEFTIDAVSQMGTPLERLAALVDFEMFRSVWFRKISSGGTASTLIYELIELTLKELFL